MNTIAEWVETVVEVVLVLSADTARVKLPNGREVFGYKGTKAMVSEPLQPGQSVRARLFVADFSRAELLGSA